MADTSFTPNMFVGSVYKKFKREIFDNVTIQQTVMKEIDQAGGLQIVDGGYNLSLNVQLTEATGFVPYSQFDNFNMFNEDLVSQAAFDMKQYYAPVVLSGFDIWRNGSKPEQIFPLVKEYTRMIQESCFRLFDLEIHTADGTANHIGGLPVVVETSGSWSTVGGIDSNSVTAWRNNLQTSAGSFAATGRGYMTTAYNNALRGSKMPKLWITTQAIDEAFHASLTVNEQYILSDKKQAYVNAGIQHKMYMGLPFIWNTNAPSGIIKLINTDVLFLWIGSGHDFEMSEFIRAPRQDAKEATILLYAQMGVAQRNAQSAIAGITTP